jgi:hypothetical protein
MSDITLEEVAAIAARVEAERAARAARLAPKVRAELDLLARFPPTARKRLAELKRKAKKDGVTFTPDEANRLVAIRIREAALAEGANLLEEEGAP